MTETYWFKHDVNSSTGRRFTRVRLKMGYEALGIYWAICEVVYRHSNCLAFATDDDKQLLAEMLRVDISKLKEVIDCCISTENLLKIVDGRLTSDKIESEFAKRGETSKKRKKAGSKGGKQKASNALANANQTPSKDPSKIKQYREEKRREEEEKKEEVEVLGEDTPPTQEFKPEEPTKPEWPSAKYRFAKQPGEDDPLPEKMIDYFKAMGREEVHFNVWMKPKELENIIAEYGEELALKVATRFAHASNDLDHQPGKPPKWQTFRGYSNHAKALRNWIKQDLKNLRHTNV